MTMQIFIKVLNPPLTSAHIRLSADITAVIEPQQ